MESITFVGNSHLDQFKINDINVPLNKKIIYVPGASIRGLLNESSFTGLNKMVYAHDSAQNIFVFHLGQVDIEFGYFYKSALNNSKLDKSEFIVQLIHIYKTFLQKLKSKIIIIGVNPSVIKDINHIFNVNFKDARCHQNNFMQETGCWQEKITIDKYKHIYNETQNDITSFLENTNIAIKNMCIENNFIFYDVWKVLVDESNNIKPEYCPMCIDHHIIPSNTLQKELSECINYYVNILNNWRCVTININKYKTIK